MINAKDLPQRSRKSLILEKIELNIIKRATLGYKKYIVLFKQFDELEQYKDEISDELLKSGYKLSTYKTKTYQDLEIYDEYLIIEWN